jgi:hypothetical protein
MDPDKPPSASLPWVADRAIYSGGHARCEHLFASVDANLAMKKRIPDRKAS